MIFHIPFHLLAMFLFPGLGFHLLHFNGVRFSAAHVELVVTHAQGQNTLVDAKTRCIEHKVLEKKHNAVLYNMLCLY